MKKSDAQITQFGKTVANLKEVLEKLKTAGSERAVFRDSAIQRFEIAFDICWKTLKEKLRFEYGTDAASPKKVFQEAFKQGIIANDAVWAEMTDVRNETSHVYSEQFADAVLLKLPAIAEALEKLLWTLKK